MQPSVALLGAGTLGGIVIAALIEAGWSPEDISALEEMNRIASLPENKRLLSEDEERLFDRKGCWTSVCEVQEEDLSKIGRK